MTIYPKNTSTTVSGFEYAQHSARSFESKRKPARRKRNHVAMILVILILYGLVLLGGLFKEGTITSNFALPSTTDDSMSEMTIRNNIETMSKLDMDSESWRGLELEEKLELYQVVADIESDYLGIPYELKVKVKDLPRDTLAAYAHKGHIVWIDRAHLYNDCADQILESTCHECYHAYQCCLCEVYDSLDVEYKDLIDFAKVQCYQNEFDNYNDGSYDINGYYSQRCEEDARVYAESAADDYYYKLRKYFPCE